MGLWVVGMYSSWLRSGVSSEDDRTARASSLSLLSSRFGSGVAPEKVSPRLLQRRQRHSEAHRVTRARPASRTVLPAFWNGLAAPACGASWSNLLLLRLRAQSSRCERPLHKRPPRPSASRGSTPTSWPRRRISRLLSRRKTSPAPDMRAPDNPPSQFCPLDSVSRAASTHSEKARKKRTLLLASTRRLSHCVEFSTP